MSVENTLGSIFKPVGLTLLVVLKFIWMILFPIRVVFSYIINFLVRHPVGFIVLIFILIFGFTIFKNIMIKRFLASFTFPAATVSTTVAKTETWHPFISAVGTAIAVEGVNINPQVPGLVTKINFKSGQMTTKGAALVEMDSRSEKAQLNSAIAAMKLAKINYDRDLKLFHKGAVAQSTIDTDKATYDEKKAMVAQYAAAVAYKTIRAPFSGKLGIRTVNVGQYLNTTDNVTNLQTINPIYVDYNLPEQDLSKVHVGQDVDVSASTYKGYKFKGKINAIDARISDSTRSILIRAVVPNNDKDHRLYPGMFTTVHTLLPDQKNLITVPTQAVTTTLYGDSVYFVDSKQVKGKDGKMTTQKIAKLGYVKVGDAMNNRTAIASGLKSGQEIVLDGQVKLYDGATIKIDNSKKKAPTAPRKE